LQSVEPHDPCANSSTVRAILFGGPPSPYSHDMDNVTLPPELERFATEAVAAGRYRDVSDVVAAGVSLLQRQEQARAELLASVQAAKEESDRSGYLNGDEVAEQVRATIARRTNAAA
jgi:antitoxin ParD1/3/4